MIDQGSWYLQKIRDLSTPDRGEFQIAPSKEHPGYFTISIGPHSYLTETFQLERLMDAYVLLTTQIAIKEGWYEVR